MNIKLTIHKQNIISFVFGVLYVTVLFFEVGCIQINQITIFIFLIFANQGFVFFVSEVFSIHIFEQGKFFGSFIKLFVCQHAILNKQFQVVPFLFELISVIFKDFLQAVGDFFGNVVGDFPHIRVVL